jgi:hypothetical protein
MSVTSRAVYPSNARQNSSQLTVQITMPTQRSMVTSRAP